MPTIRELTGELSFNADTTGATRFDQAVNRSKGNLEQLNAVSLAPFVGTMAKAWGLVTGAATLGTAAAAKRFIDLEKAYEFLEFKTKDATGTIRGEIESILQDKLLKNLVNEIDLVSAALQSAGEGARPEQITRFLRLATQLSLVTQENARELLRLFTKGELKEVMKVLGQLPLEVQEILKAGGIDPSKIGLIGSRAELERRLLGVQPELEKRIAEQRERGLTTFDELGGVFEKLTVEVGEKTLKGFQGLNSVLIPFVERLTAFTKGEITAKEILGLPAEIQPKRDIFSNEFRKGIGDDVSEAANDLIDKIRGFKFEDADFGIFNPFQFIQTTPVTGPITRAAATTQSTTNNRGGDTIINATINVQGGDTAKQTGENVAKELRKVMGNISEQAKQSTIRRGGQ